MASLSLVSLNIEHSKHLERIMPFLHERKPDVLCVQELNKSDIPVFEQQVGAGHFVPMLYSSVMGGENGLGIFSRYPITQRNVHYYRRTSENIPEYDSKSAATKYVTEHMMLLVCDIQKDSVEYRIGTTHFAWTPNGEADDFQRKDLQALLPLLKQNEPLVLCGDFNAPRGGEIYQEISARYTDAVPSHFKTSLDVNLHRAGKDRPEELENKMVDYVFTSPPYQAVDVELVFGVSDHSAVVGSIQKLA